MRTSSHCYGETKMKRIECSEKMLVRVGTVDLTKTCAVMQVQGNSRPKWRLRRAPCRAFLMSFL
jgi:hypothetical protein